MNNSKNEILNELDTNYKSNIQELKFFNSYQNKIFKDIYDFESDIDLSKYYIKKEYDSVKITSKSKDKEIEITDSIDEILSKGKITDEDAKLIVQLMKQKGWTNISKVNFNNSNKEFVKKISDEFENNNSK
jgi:phage I-like protein